MCDALKSLDLNAFPADLRDVVSGLIASHQASVSILHEDIARLSTQNAELEAPNARLEHYVKELN